MFKPIEDGPRTQEYKNGLIRQDVPKDEVICQGLVRG